MNETETERKRKRERGRVSLYPFVSSVRSIINLSPIPGLKVASTERNNVLCMELSVLENK